MTSEAREQEIALMEAHMIGFADAYFAARNPMLDTADRRRVFEAGFKAAWNERAEAIEAARVEAEKLRADAQAFRDAIYYGLTITPNYHVGQESAGVLEFTELVDSVDPCAATRQAVERAVGKLRSLAKEAP